MGAFEYQTAVATTLNVHPDLPSVSALIDRSGQVTVSDCAAQVAAPLSHPHIPLASSGVDQL